jgi:glutathione S-transferase
VKLYYAPLACSMAARISVYEAGGAQVEFVYVDIHTRPDARLLADGSDYRAINPLGQVPAVQTAEGVLITENPAVLQYIADRYPESRFAPRGGLERSQLHQWLSFIGTELHKATFIPLLTPSSPEGAKLFARQKLPLRFGHLSNHLKARSFLLEDFTVGDAYLFTVLNWSPYAGIDLSEWPTLQTYLKRLSARPSIARALSEEGQLFKAEQARVAVK